MICEIGYWRCMISGVHRICALSALWGTVASCLLYRGSATKEAHLENGSLPSPSGWSLKESLCRCFLLRIWQCQFQRWRKVSNRTWPTSADRAVLGYSRITPRNFTKVVAGFAQHTVVACVLRGQEIVGHVSACVINHGVNAKMVALPTRYETVIFATMGLSIRRVWGILFFNRNTQFAIASMGSNSSPWFS